MILQTNFDNFVKGEEFSVRFDPLLGSGIFNSDGHQWYFARKLAANIFSQAR